MDVDVGEARVGELLDLLAMLGLARAADDRAGDVLTGERRGRLVEVAWQRQLLAELAFQSRVAPPPPSSPALRQQRKAVSIARSRLSSTQTVSCPYFGLPLPPALSNVLTISLFGEVETSASPTRPASSAAPSAAAATAIGGGSSGIE